MLKYRRAVLKLSGEAFGGQGGCLGARELRSTAGKIASAVAIGAELAVVVGGGNIVRGQRTDLGIARVTADHMGMLATLINALALSEVFTGMGVRSAVLSAVPAGSMADPYSPRKCLDIITQGAVAVLAGGTGNPYFSTDTAAALRAAELDADVLLKATKVDGVYSADPKKDPKARKFSRLTYGEAIEKRLGVMDMAAFSVCMENEIPIVVFDMEDKANIVRAIRGEAVGTCVGSDASRRAGTESRPRRRA